MEIAGVGGEGEGGEVGLWRGEEEWEGGCGGGGGGFACGGGGRGEGMRERCLEKSVGLAKQICEGGPVAVGAGLRAVKGAGMEGMGEGEAEGEMYEVVRRTRDRDEALVGFGEKRRVAFRGY